MQERDTVALNLTESHKTVKNIKARGAFTVSIADAAHVVEADYFGVESGNRTADKFKNSGLTASRSEAVDAPVINEFPLCLECRFIEYQNNDFGCGVIGKVVRVESFASSRLSSVWKRSSYAVSSIFVSLLLANLCHLLSKLLIGCGNLAAFVVGKDTFAFCGSFHCTDRMRYLGIKYLDFLTVCTFDRCCNLLRNVGTEHYHSH